MPRLPRIQPLFDTKRRRWKVDIPASRSASGKRLRLWFSSRDEAREYVSSLDPADRSTAIHAKLAHDAADAIAILEPLEMDLTQAAREIAAAREALGGCGSVLDACIHYRQEQDRRKRSRTLSDAINDFLLTRLHLRDATIKSYNYTLQKVLRPLHPMMMAEITGQDLSSLLDSKGQSAREMHRRTLRVFWKWASSPPREWTDTRAVDSLEASRKSLDNDIRILTPEEARALLNAAEKCSPSAAVAYAVAIFAGVRMAELARLCWKDIREEHIEVGKAISKKHSRRLIPICMTLRAWFDAYKGEANPNDLLVGTNWVDVSKSVRRLAGWNVAARLLDKPPAPTRGPWPENSPRHTCASVQAAIGTEITDLIFKFGHSGGPELLRRHYVARLTRKEAIDILSIGPRGTTISLSVSE